MPIEIKELIIRTTISSLENTKATKSGPEQSQNAAHFDKEYYDRVIKICTEKVLERIKEIKQP